MADSEKFIDSHCHLPKNRFLREWDQNIQKWRKMGIKAIIGVSMTKNESLRIIELARNEDIIIPAIGIHPWKVKKDIDANSLYDEYAKIIKNHPNVAAIGEVGLDYRFVEKIERYPFQRKVFETFSMLARDFQLILNIHCVNATKDLLEILRKNNIPAKQCIFHWYSGTEEELQEVLRFGPYFSITPAVEYSKTHQNTARQAPLNKILTESDGDVKYKNGTRGSPESIPQVIKNLATIRETDIEEMKAQIWSNFCKLFSKKEDGLST